MKDKRVIKRIELGEKEDKEVYEVGVNGVLEIVPFNVKHPKYGEKLYMYRIRAEHDGILFAREEVSNIKYESRVKPIRKDLLKLFSFSLLISLIVGLFKGLITLKTIGILLLGGVAILVAILVLVVCISFLIR